MEALEQQFLLGGADAGAPITYLHQARRGVDLDLAAGGRVGDRVLHERVQGPIQFRAYAPAEGRDDRFGDVDRHAPSGGGFAEPLRRIPRSRGEVAARDRGGGLAGAAEGEQLVDDPREAVDLAPTPARGPSAGSVAERLETELQAGEWRAQLV